MTLASGSRCISSSLGIEGLAHEDTERYSAVIIVNTCIAWALDRRVETFLERQRDHANIVVLTTAGDAKWMPDTKGRNYYAITTASIKTDVQKVADEVMGRVRTVLGGAS